MNTRIGADKILQSLGSGLAHATFQLLRRTSLGHAAQRYRAEQ